MNNKSKATWHYQDCALLLIDYQPEVMEHIHERDKNLIELNVIAVARMATKLNIPIVLSTVAVKMGVEGPTISSLKDVLPGVEEIDRTSTNAWDDKIFVKAVKATGRRRLVIAGIVTSVCLAFAAVEALSEGYEVMFIEDAVGDISKNEHELAVMRLVQAGAVPNSAIALITEWFQDWASPEANSAREIFPDYLVNSYSMRGFSLPSSLEQSTKKESAAAMV